MIFTPNFSINPRLLQFLLRIEKHREAISVLPMTGKLIASLRETARLLTTHYSTQIEGNALSEEEVKQVAKGNSGGFPGRERDEIEVRNYFKALEYVEAQLAHQQVVSENFIQTIHGLVYHGKQHPTAYREGQNVIRDGQNGAIVYMPPEASDVETLMKELVIWIDTQIQSQELPAPVIAGITHYQFATIHPYYDGNGRTARLLTTYILHLLGYGMHGIYSLEEYYAKNLVHYYKALTIGDSHNYYGGRAEADITPFLDYFLEGMAIAFESVRHKAEALHLARPSSTLETHAIELRSLSPQQRQVLSLFEQYQEVTSQQVAQHLGINSRSAYGLIQKWIDNGFVCVANPSKRARTYGLTSQWETLLR